MRLTREEVQRLLGIAGAERAQERRLRETPPTPEPQRLIHVRYARRVVREAELTVPRSLAVEDLSDEEFKRRLWTVVLDNAAPLPNPISDEIEVYTVEELGEVAAASVVLNDGVLRHVRDVKRRIDAYLDPDEHDDEHDDEDVDDGQALIERAHDVLRVIIATQEGA